MIVKINDYQLDYLRRNFPERIGLIFTKKVDEKDLSALIELDDEAADEIRDWAIEKQQEVGFNEGYELTEDGKFLQELIDIFFTG